MQEEFDNENAVAREVALEAANVLEALFPNVFGDKRCRKFLRSKNLLVHADNEDFFVIRAIEDADLAPFGNGFVSAPEIIVIELFVAGSFKGVDVAALGIDARHGMFDDTVFAG